MTKVDVSALESVLKILSIELQAAERSYSQSRLEQGRTRARLRHQWSRHMERAAQLAAECALAEHAMEDPMRVVLQASGGEGAFRLADSLRPAVPAQLAGGVWSSPCGVLYTEVPPDAPQA